MQKSLNIEGLRVNVRRELGRYGDKNDDFFRTAFSRSKNRSNQNRKVGKIVRIKAPHKRFDYEG